MEDIKISDELKRILEEREYSLEGNLEEIYLKDVKLNNILINEIVQLFPNLESVTLINVNLVDDDLDDIFKLNNLKYLNISSNEISVNKLFELIGLGKLQKLDAIGLYDTPVGTLLNMYDNLVLYATQKRAVYKLVEMYESLIPTETKKEEMLLKYNPKKENLTKYCGQMPVDIKDLYYACPNLTEIDFSVQTIASRGFPEFYMFHNLKKLKIKIEVFKNYKKVFLGLRAIENLTELDVSNSINFGDEFIPMIVKLKNLKSICLANTDVKPLALVYLSKLEKLERLDITNIKSVDLLPNDLIERKNAREIISYIKDNFELEVSPSEKLKEILNKHEYDYKNRYLEVLGLPGIDLDYDLIKELITLYPNLKHLDINTTNVGDAECELLSKLKNLEWLDISGNSNITNRGIKELCKLTKLRWLDVSLSNLDDECVDDLVKLQDLELLLISATRLSVFPLYKLKALKKLKHLDLIRTDAGDKLPYKLVQTKDARQILEFIEMKSNDNVPICNYRLMVLGEPGCGKTTIYSKITGDYRKETSTLGINIKPFDAKLIDENMKDINLNIWDFGGQDYQTSIHEIFLSENCLFTIVVEPRMNDSAKNFKKWYDLIKRYVHIRDLDSFPLIVLFSKIDDMNGGLGYLVNGEEGLDKLKSEITDIIRQDLCSRLGEENPDCKLNIKFIKASAVKENGLADYMSTLQESFNRIINYSSIVVSKEAKMLGYELARRREESFYLDLKAVRAIYRDINERLNIANPERIERALSSLSYYGDILYLPNTRYVFIDPNTISEIIYNLLINAKYPEALKKYDEYLSPERIRALDLEDGEGLGLVGKEYKNMPSDLWEILLKVFSDNDLLVNIGNNEYLIPNRASYLPHSLIYDKLREYNSTTEYSLEGSRHFVISFELESKGILYKLESKLAKELENEGFIDTEIYSNAFIVKASINSKKEIAIFYQESLSNEIDFYISEGSVENGLFVKINNSINSLEIPFKLYAVCPCKGRNENECSYRYDLSELKNASTDNSFLIHCVNSQRLLPVRAFLRSSIINTDQLVVGSKHRSIAKDNIFVIMPFGNGGNKDKYDAMFKAIKESASEANELLKLDTALKDPIGEIVRVDKRPDDGKTIDEMIINHIQESSIIITILEGNRPNCYFEYGMARCYQGKSFITISAKGDELPFDVDHHQIKFIDRNDYENNYKELRAIISKDLRAILLERHKNS